MENKKRFINNSLVNSMRGKSCEICKKRSLTSGFHIKPKSLGGPDIMDNVICLCFKHQQEIQKSLAKFVIRYPKMKSILLFKGWEFNDTYNDWFHYGITDVMEMEAVTRLIQ